MKQMRSILAPLLMLLTGVLMTSCDDEQETAMMLWGTWEGQLSTEFYQDRWGGYGQTYYTVWHFEGKPGSRHGKGWEIDYVGHQRYAQHFDWQVIDDGRTVRLHYAGAWDDEWIYNFYLDDSYFTGYIDSGDGKQSFSNWSAWRTTATTTTTAGTSVRRGRCRPRELPRRENRDFSPKE